MKKYTVTITSERTEYSSYTFELEAKSLEAAKAKAKKLTDDEDFIEEYNENCDPGDAYENFTVQEVEEI